MQSPCLKKIVFKIKQLMHALRLFMIKYTTSSVLRPPIKHEVHNFQLLYFHFWQCFRDVSTRTDCQKNLNNCWYPLAVTNPWDKKKITNWDATIMQPKLIITEGKQDFSGWIHIKTLPNPVRFFYRAAWLMLKNLWWWYWLEFLRLIDRPCSNCKECNVVY